MSWTWCASNPARARAACGAHFRHPSVLSWSSHDRPRPALTPLSPRSFPPQLFANVTLLDKSVASKGEPRFVAKVLRQVRCALRNRA
eukprot:30694-Pelagococcus_subviridis.AAC.5